MQNLKVANARYFLPLLVAVVASVAPLAVHGFSMGHDWILELVRIAEFRFAYLDGQVPPFWAPDLYGGLGSPIFLFYAPLYLALASALTPITGSIFSAATTALVIFTLVGGLLMWLFVREAAPEFPVAARIAAILYVLHPYLLADKWIRNANAEFAALSLLPGVLLGAITRNPISAFWWTTVSLATVILAHNITAPMAIVLAIAATLFVHRNVRALVPVAAGIAASLVLTSFLWLPAFVFKSLIRTEDLLNGKFDFHTQFPSIGLLFWPLDFYSGGWLTLLLLAASVFVPASDVYTKRVARGLGIAAIVFVVLMLPVSLPVWERVPLLPYEQFPWRFMGPLALAVGAGGAIASTRLPRSVPLWLIEWIVIVFALINAYPAFKQYTALTPELRTRAEQLLTRQGIEHNNLSTTVHDEYLPHTADPHAADQRAIGLLPRRWAFPVWSAKLEGQSVAVEPGPDGVISINVPREKEGYISLELIEPRVRKISKVVSLLAALALLALAIISYRRNRARAAGVVLVSKSKRRH